MVDTTDIILEQVDHKVTLDNLLLQVRTAQNQNGLRNNSDFGRYHRYCKNRVERIRRNLNFTHHPKVYNKDLQVTAKLVMKDLRHLMVQVFLIEANWAYAMQMKQIATNANNKGAGHIQMESQQAMVNRNPNRLRQHAIKRLKKAFSLSEELLLIAGDGLDSISVFEVRAYVAQMQANYLMEANKHEDAMGSLLDSKLIYEELRRLKDPDSDEGIVYNEKIDQVGTFIRKTAMDLGMIETSDDLKPADAEQTKQDFLKAHADQQAVVQNREMTDAFAPLNLFGQQIILKNEKLHTVFKAIEQSFVQIAQQKNSQLEVREKEEKLADLYMMTIGQLTEALPIIEREKNEEKKKNEAISSVFTTLPGLVQDSKLRQAAERNMLQANSLARTFDVDTVFANTETKVSAVRPQNIVRQLEKALRSYQQITKALHSSPEDNFVCEYLNCMVSYFVAMTYASDKKFSQAYLLSTRAFRCYEQCQQDVEAKLGGAAHIKASRPAIGEKLVQMTNLIESLEKVRVRCHAKMLLQKAEQKRAMHESMGNLQIDTSAQAQGDTCQMKIENLYDLLFDSFGNAKSAGNLERKAKIIGGEAPMSILDNRGFSIQFEDLGRPAVDISKLKVNKSFKVMNTIPRFQSVPATPQLFDLAGGLISYPDLTEEKAQFVQEEQAAASGIMGAMSGAIGSFFGRK